MSPINKVLKKIILLETYSVKSCDQTWAMLFSAHKEKTNLMSTSGFINLEFFKNFLAKITRFKTDNNTKSPDLPISTNDPSKASFHCHLML